MHCMDMLMSVGGVARWVSVCHYTYSVLGFSGTQSFHINVRKLVRFQHRDERIPGRLCRESSLALSCVCACAGHAKRALSVTETCTSA